ncbi:tyrosine-protein phosphatase [Levilactobacillus spicheri]|uniref:Uncharacterized protein n=2 Tax=Levilactobacillus spicheri TaxID=216463 RepID=A0ABQ0WPD7_9LACO|nr:tyrosine-protein phosphatase [Levilactobacillus spicheri]KRL49738.1 hypothetical protein FD37_GL002458 [Levilactobacillus spicheri DSM 15429]GEO66896.1 hypothetical protein LSP04_13150 [Levilactobacillus spicheri]
MERTRVLQLAGGFNFRELGGYQTKSGQTIAWQRLLRTAHLSSLTGNDWDQLIDYGGGFSYDGTRRR